MSNLRDSEDAVWSQQQLRYWTPSNRVRPEEKPVSGPTISAGPTGVGSRVPLFQFYRKAEPDLASKTWFFELEAVNSVHVFSRDSEAMLPPIQTTRQLIEGHVEGHGP
jgi:hypothetical protein